MNLGTSRSPVSIAGDDNGRTYTEVSSSEQKRRCCHRRHRLPSLHPSCRNKHRPSLTTTAKQQETGKKKRPTPETLNSWDTQPSCPHERITHTGLERPPSVARRKRLGGFIYGCSLAHQSNGPYRFPTYRAPNLINRRLNSRTPG